MIQFINSIQLKKKKGEKRKKKEKKKKQERKTPINKVVKISYSVALSSLFGHLSFLFEDLQSYVKYDLYHPGIFFVQSRNIIDLFYFGFDSFYILKYIFYNCKFNRSILKPIP